MNDETIQQEADERRGYFRIDDRVKLSYRSISEEELPELIGRLKTGAGSNFTVMSSFTSMSQQMVVQLRRIEGSSPDVAACIKILDRKLNILGRAFLVQEDAVSNQPSKAVNISAGGISFNSAEFYEEGTALELKLLLLPDMTGMMVYGEVIACSEVEDAEETDEPYSLQISFPNIREPDRDLLIRHILKRQGEWLRKRRKENEATNSETE